MFAALGTLPHLIFLVACESATRDAQAESPFVGLAPKLVQAGGPAVGPMQDLGPDDLSPPRGGARGRGREGVLRDGAQAGAGWRARRRGHAGPGSDRSGPPAGGRVLRAAG